MKPDAPTYVLTGALRRETVLPPNGRPLVDAPGGSLLYAAAGLAVWDGGAGLLSRVGEDYPAGWLAALEGRGFDRRGVCILPGALDVRSFLAYTGPQTAHRTNPVGHFARLGLSIPKSLLGYQPPDEKFDGRAEPPPAAPRLADIPLEYLEARAAHFCPLDLGTHSLLASAFRQAAVPTLTVDPASAYMVTAGWDGVRSLLHGLTAFLPSEEEARALFWGSTDDLWQMADELGSFGCEIIVIKRGGRGQLLYDAVGRKRWQAPAYPVQVVDPTGAGDSFCGGFLAGYRQSYDPLRAVLQGNVSASLTIEGSGAFHALEALPGLAQARLDALGDNVRQV
ncbi:MAG: carbohydrate kinase family protein [Chloroflexi bacterium]|nr:carbohydrate kinase family protein [Chloroflexota bacterium]